jgi:uncharacterized protein involved in exopolysaccharide biosynthesis
MNPQTQPEQFDPQFIIAKYLSPVLEYKWIVLICTLLGLAISLPISFVIQPEYSSIATTQLETPRAQMISKVTEEITSRTGDKNYITAAIERMHSAAFRTEVLKVLPKQLQNDLETPLGVIGQLKKKASPYIRKILKKEPLNSTEQATITPERLNKLSKRIKIQGKPSKGIIQITGTTFAQEMATILVQSYIDIWVALNMETNKSLIRHELGFTKSQKDEYFKQLKNSEKELRLFKQKFEIPPALSSVTDMELQSQLDVLQNKVINAKERYKRIDDIYLDLVRKEKAVVNNIKVINPPQAPLKPSKNLQFTIVLIGLLLGAAAGIAPILAWDYYRGNIRHKNDVASAVNIPIIGKLPTIK